MGRRRIGLLTLLLVITAACGDDATATTEPATGAFPAVVRGVEIPSQPERIVSLSATHTEILYELGAGPQVIATDFFSDYPAAAAGTDKVDAYELNVEAIAALDPDLIILAYDPGEAVSGFTALGIPAVLFPPPGPATLDEVWEEFADVGRATGHEEEGADLVATMQDEIAAIVDALPQTLRAPSYYLELDPTLFTVGPGSLLDTLLRTLGMENIAGEDADPFLQLSAEALLAADPEFVFLADTVCCGESPESFAARPGFSETSAVADGHVFGLDDSVASRWGPRLVELMQTVAKEAYGI